MGDIDKGEEIEIKNITLWQVFSNLEGSWRIERALEGYSNMEGIAFFKKIQNNNKPYYYYYKEEGILQLLTGNQSRVYREYAYCYKEKTIHVYFWDIISKQEGQLLYTLYLPNTCKKRPWPLHAYGTHRCSPDTYDAHYKFINNDNFELIYRVSGPHKNYTIKTIFCRLGQHIK
ncbi:MAG: DUF6314 family protein [Candidatus Amoebophilus sp.]